MVQSTPHLPQVGERSPQTWQQYTQTQTQEKEKEIGVTDRTKDKPIEKKKQDVNDDDSKSKEYESVEYPNYLLVTDLNNIPFENDIQKFTGAQIDLQKRKLIKSALGHGLKLKSLDQDLTDQRNRKALERS